MLKNLRNLYMTFVRLLQEIYFECDKNFVKIFK